ncbi:MAG: redox-regulated ATPase YchF [Nitrospirae bacterium]|nr:redox-regulated ATPase YchF [Nitrospirota bacterium]
MGFNCGIVGLPNVGKSTIFNALTSAGANVANYPFCTIDQNVGVVGVPDQRMDRLVEMFKPEKITPTTLEFVDIAGLVKGASAGEGLGNKFLGHIREVDAIVHVVRCFDDPDVVHIYGGVDPKMDIDIIETELALSDLDSLSKRIQRAEKASKSGEKGAAVEKEFLTKLSDMLSQGKPLRSPLLSNAYSDEEKKILNEMHLLTIKPVLYVANVTEEEMLEGNEFVRQIEELAEKEGAKVITVCGKIEDELSSMSLAEHKEFLEEMGLSEPGLFKIIREGYSLLNLITFFTAGEKEVRAWTVLQGTKAPQAAGKIHSDIERGFIRAEIMSYNDLDSLGSSQAVKEKGLLRLEGKEYVMQEGDIVYFRFHV